uniref:Uncharacterized protein n=1 Tax=Opuntia streptacantha TaxID=393608 RepID=A0A7C9EA15_OPUST
MLGEFPIAIISRLRSLRGLIRAAMERGSRSIWLTLRLQVESAIVVVITTTKTIILIVVIIIDSPIIIAAIAMAIVVDAAASAMAVLKREISFANGLKVRVAGDDGAVVGEASPASSATSERRTGRHGGGDAVERERG